MTELPWGRHLVTRPDHYRVEYAINPWMDLADPVDPGRARVQWDALVATLQRLGAQVEVIEQRPDSPDMVYAMNLGWAWADPSGGRVVLSHMRYPQRRAETMSAASWFAAAGFAVSSVGADGIGPFLEAGDAFPYGDALVVGYGPRTSAEALKHVAAEMDVRVLGLRIVHPRMYHLDLSFCPLDARHALVCPEAFDPPSAAALLDRVPDPIVLTQAEAFTFCANSVVVGRTVVMPACPPRVRDELVRRGFEVLLVDVSEFHKGGGSLRCLTNPLDFAVDAARVPGGEVVLPS